MNGKQSHSRAGRAGQWLLLVLVALLLAGCDMSSTPLVPTPTVTPPMPTPQLLGTTVELPTGVGPVVGEPPEPTATPYDEALPAWTVMFYSSADTPAASYAWESLNQMEAAGTSEQVQVVAAVDWPATVAGANPLPARYVIRGDDDPGVLASEEAVGATETNFGDPQVLADFITWAMTNYPANRYALILDGYGGGRYGCCLDQVAPGAGAGDALSLADIHSALSGTLPAQTDPTAAPHTLDVIAFSGSMMADLEVFQTLAPFGDYAVASAALVPGGAWNYENLLGTLYANPWQDGRALADLMVSSYVDYQRNLIGNEFVSMTAVALAAIPDLAAAVETLALALNADPATTFGPAADARRGAQTYGEVLTDLDAATTTVDLGHAATLLSQNTALPDVAVTARAVAVAAESATISHAAGVGLPFATGMGIFWPAVPTPEALTSSAELPRWQQFVIGFVQNAALLPPPLVGVAAAGDSMASSSSPVVIYGEVFAQQLEAMQLVTTQDDGTGGRVLLQANTIHPPLVTTADGLTGAVAWPDGRYAAEFAWNAVVTYLYDAAGASSAALLRALLPTRDLSLAGVTGSLVHGPGGNPLDTVLEFPGTNAVPSHVWHLATSVAGLPFVHEIAPAAGDLFVPRLLQLTAAGQWHPFNGTGLQFDDVPAIYRSTRPLEDGPYQVGVSAAVLGAHRATSDVEVRVNQIGALAGYSAFADPELGVEFVYPEGWVAPQREGDSVVTGDSVQDVSLRVRVVENWTGDATALVEQALSGLGEVTRLNESDVTIGGEGSGVPGRRVAYGYTGADDQIRTGILTAFARDGRGTLIDLDARQSYGVELLALDDAIIANWRFVASTNEQPAVWLQALLANYDVVYPPGMTFEDVNGWFRFVDGERFIAVRIQPGTRTPEEALASLLAAAGEGVTDFQPQDSAPIYLGGAHWQNGRFTYQSSQGTPMAGIILTRPDNGNELAVWSEWPAASDVARNEAIALAVAAGMRRHQEGTSQ